MRSGPTSTGTPPNTSSPKTGTWYPSTAAAAIPTTCSTGRRATPFSPIEQSAETLRNYRELPDSTVAVNLKFLIHFVGDMHCPAHIKYAGRNMKYDVLFEDKYHKPHKYYIHHVWDNEIITTTRIWSVSEWADELDRLPDSEIDAITAGTPRDWLHDAAVCCLVQFDIARPDQRLGQDFLNEALPAGRKPDTQGRIQAC